MIILTTHSNAIFLKFHEAVWHYKLRNRFNYYNLIRNVRDVKNLRT